MFLAASKPGAGTPDRQLVWASFDGAVEDVEVNLPRISLPQLSPDGTALVFLSSRSDGFINLWTHALERQVTARLTFDARYDIYPAWTPDQTRVVYGAGVLGMDLNLMIRSADGTGDERQLTDSGHVSNPVVTSDGRTIVFTYCRQSCDIARIGIDAGDPMELLLETDSDEIAPAVSPDMRWIAYASAESGRTEVYVRPYPDLNGGRWQISVNGGSFPVWSENGSSLYFIEPQSSTLMEAAVTGEGGFATDRPAAVLDVSPFLWRSPQGNRNFAVDSNAQRILTLRLTDESTVIRVVLNWFDELERLVPTGR